MGKTDEIEALIRNGPGEGKELYQAAASVIFEIPYDNVTPELRREAKVRVFGYVYSSKYETFAPGEVARFELREWLKQFKGTFSR